MDKKGQKLLVFPTNFGGPSYPAARWVFPRLWNGAKGCEARGSSEAQRAGGTAATWVTAPVLEGGGPDPHQALRTTLTPQGLPTQGPLPLWDFAFVSMEDSADVLPRTPLIPHGTVLRHGAD